MQLALTAIVTGCVVASEDAKEWIRDNYYLHYVALIAGAILMCVIACCKNNARKVPRNYILLAAFTLCWTYMVAGFTQWFEPEDIFIAITLTTAMVFGLTLFACFCKMSLTWLWGIAAAGSIAVWPMIIFFWVFPSKALLNIISFVVVVLTSIYIILDTKRIMTELSVDEYIIGALFLYADII